MEKFIIGLILIAGILVTTAIFGLLLAFPIMWCWNYTMPVIFGLIKISWGQAWCLNFLTGCLIKSTLTNSSK